MFELYFLCSFYIKYQKETIKGSITEKVTSDNIDINEFI